MAQAQVTVILLLKLMGQALRLTKAAAVVAAAIWLMAAPVALVS